jgi:hypothetical protein
MTSRKQAGPHQRCGRDFCCCATASVSRKPAATCGPQPPLPLVAGARRAVGRAELPDSVRVFISSPVPGALMALGLSAAALRAAVDALGGVAGIAGLTLAQVRSVLTRHERASRSAARAAGALSARCDPRRRANLTCAEAAARSHNAGGGSTARSRSVR